MESWKFFQLSLPLIGDIKSRGVLPLGRPDSVWHIFQLGSCRLQPVEGMGFLGWLEIAWHRFGRARWRRVLLKKKKKKNQVSSRTQEGVKEQLTGTLGLMTTLGACGCGPRVGVPGPLVVI